MLSGYSNFGYVKFCAHMACLPQLIADLVLDCILLFSLHRYVDMIANPEVADIFRKRAKVGRYFFHKCCLLFTEDTLW